MRLSLSNHLWRFVLARRQQYFRQRFLSPVAFAAAAATTTAAAAAAADVAG